MKIRAHAESCNLHKIIRHNEIFKIKMVHYSGDFVAVIADIDYSNLVREIIFDNSNTCILNNGLQLLNNTFPLNFMILNDFKIC